MDDASKLGPLWVAQLTKVVTEHRNRAAENLLVIKPDGDFAKQHRILIDAANTMLAAPDLFAACTEILRYAPGKWVDDDRSQDEIDSGNTAAFEAIAAAMAKATGSAS